MKTVVEYRIRPHSYKGNTYTIEQWTDGKYQTVAAYVTGEEQAEHVRRALQTAYEYGYNDCTEDAIATAEAGVNP